MTTTLQEVLAGENPLGAMVTNLEALNIRKHDIVVPAQKIVYADQKLWIPENVGGAVPMSVDYTPTEICHDQIAWKLGIPVQYYKRMKADYPALLENNINMWMAKSEKVKYLLRTFSADNDNISVGRALLSDRFHMLDNYDVLIQALDAIKKMGVKVKITKAEVSDRRMYLHVVCPEIEMQADAFLREYLKENNAAGNGIVSGFVLTNSEVGLGSFEIRPRAVICKCNNGLVVTDEKFSRVHLGGKMEEGTIKWSENTKKKNYELVMSQTQDAVRTFLSGDYLGKMVEKIADAHNIKLEMPVDCVQNVCKEMGVTEKHAQNVLRFFMEDGDHRATGVFQAITKEAQNMGVDTQWEVESSAVKMLENIKKYDKKFDPKKASKN